MKTYNAVVIIGSVAYDEIMNFPSLFAKHLHADKLDHINVSFVVDKLEKHLGGTATNIAYNLSLVSEKKKKIIAGVGADNQQFIDFFQSHGIDTTSIIQDPEQYTATGKVITDSKGNQIWGFYYGACVSARDIILSDHMKSDELVILSATHKEPFLKAQKEVIEMGADYLYDPGMSLTFLSNTELYDGVMNATWLVGNEYEINHIEKTLSLSVSSLIEKGIPVITTLGEKGVQYQDKKNVYQVQACSGIHQVDPTGAGDAWRAGFAGGIIEGMSIFDALCQGNALASFQIEQYGTVNHTPTNNEIKARARELQG